MVRRAASLRVVFGIVALDLIGFGILIPQLGVYGVRFGAYHIYFPQLLKPGARSLAALLWAELNLDCGALPAGAEHGLVVSRLFEAWAHRREDRLLHHLGDLKRHLAREVETWH